MSPPIPDIPMPDPSKYSKSEEFQKGLKWIEIGIALIIIGVVMGTIMPFLGFDPLSYPFIPFFALITILVGITLIITGWQLRY